MTRRTTGSAVDDCDVTLSLARRAERFPDRTAVVDVSEERLDAPAETVHEDRVTYAELSRIAAGTAAALDQRGVGSGDTVCLVTRNRVASIAHLFACRRLGATLAPISHRLTPTTVTRPFDALDPELVVAETAQRDLVRSIPADGTVTLEALADADASTDGVSPRPSRPDAPVLALHGAAGRPVARFDAATLEWNCVDAVVTWGLSRDDAVFALDPLSTADGLARGALPALYVGGTLLLDRAFDPGDALETIERHDATVATGRASPFEALAADENAAALAGLDRAVCAHPFGGDALETLLERDVTVSRAYGSLGCPTATSGTVSPSTPATAVGRPVLDCRARLVDDGTVLEGAAAGRLELAGPVVADELASVAAADDGPNADSRVVSTDRETRSDDVDGVDDGWIDTGERFRRDEDGVYHLE